ncbi:c-type cytochrome [Novosphingobium profundi]|uniref:c-type cytochrome n=1 Tax=Novosphingobium profundi TaxID=1774954 RepID=UPI001BD9E38F|nr:c-type cytochrome [Novosphingobium profundi]MBT0668179.1 c-type cytochrome [Novosphingobium profundi]
MKPVRIALAASAGLAGLALALSQGAGADTRREADKLTYHYDAGRQGWYDGESELTPQAVAGPAFGQIWQSPVLDGFGEVPARLFASPLYIADLAFDAGPFAGKALPLAFAVTSTGYAYAIHAGPDAGRNAGAAPGAILWKRRLTETPCQDGQMGNLSTPVIDRAAGRLYVTSCRDDWVWDVHALDLRTGAEIAGWPLEVSARTVTADVNRNGTSHFVAGQTYFQRGALNLSADGGKLYVAFGPDMQGFLVSLDTGADGRAKPAITSAFSSMPSETMQQGGMWGASGPAIDGEGRIAIASGASVLNALNQGGIPGIYPDVDHAWGQSILQLRDEPGKGPGTGLTLIGAFSPFNYCQTAASDIDIASSGVVAFDLPAGSSRTVHLLGLGAAKQGLAYLLDREHMPGNVTRRHACSSDPASDGSLLDPAVQPAFGSRGPTLVFGPYSDTIGMGNSAKSRSVLAHFRSRDGADYLYFAGSAKEGEDFGTNVPPSLVRARVVAEPGKDAYLRVDAREMSVTLQNPGPPVVTSHGGEGGVVWVLDPNAPRSVDVYQKDAPGARLHAFDAQTLKPLWNSGNALYTSGKYNEVAAMDGMVIVGTDRLQAFGLRTATTPRFADAPVRKAVATSDAAVGKAVYDARCSSCHSAASSGAPPVTVLATYPLERIVSVLTEGKMKEMAAGLSRDHVRAVAEHVRAQGAQH